MKFKINNTIVTTYDIKTQQEYMIKGYYPIDEDIQPSQKEIEVVDEFTIKKKPARKG